MSLMSLPLNSPHFPRFLCFAVIALMGSTPLIGRAEPPAPKSDTRVENAAIFVPQDTFQELKLAGAKLFGGPVTLVVAGSGHIAGVINPPSKPKYQYWTNDKRAATLEAWFEGATEHPGSWWPHYADWLARYSGDLVRAREPGAKLGTIEDAPGSYVKAKA